MLQSILHRSVSDHYPLFDQLNTLHNLIVMSDVMEPHSEVAPAVVKSETITTVTSDEDGVTTTVTTIEIEEEFNLEDAKADDPDFNPFAPRGKAPGVAGPGPKQPQSAAFAQATAAGAKNVRR